MSRHSPGHNPAVEPFDCCFASLTELAGSAEDPGAVLEHGDRALWELNRQLLELRDLTENLRADRVEARRWARGLEHGVVPFDTSNPLVWLTAPLEVDGE